MKMAIIRKENNDVIGKFEYGPECKIRFQLPDGSHVSPVTLGWENNIYKVVEFAQFKLPDGKRVTGSATYELIEGVLVENMPVADMPAPGPLNFPLKRWQFKAMVDYLGKSGAIEDAIEAIQDPLERAVAMARYRDSDIYERDDPLFDQLAPVVGLTDAEIDAAWMQIATGDA